MRRKITGEYGTRTPNGEGFINITPWIWMVPIAYILFGGGVAIALLVIWAIVIVAIVIGARRIGKTIEPTPTKIELP